MKRIWSVETETNAYCDDLVNGSLVKCLNYCKNELSSAPFDFQLALLEVDKGIVVDTLRIIKKEEVMEMIEKI